MAPKVYGAWHLDRLTREQPLDFFVIYSSVAAVFGSRGQANHAAANTYLDALAHSRRRAEMPALTINWGVWSEIGAAVRLGVDRKASGQGIGTIDPAGGLMVLEQLMRERATQAVVFPVDWTKYAEHAGAGPLPLFLSAVLPRSRARTEKPVAAKQEIPALLTQLEQTPPDGRPRVVLAHIRDQAVRVLALPASRQLDPKQPLSELGLDSLLAVELRNVLSTSIGKPLPATLLFDYPTVEALASFLGREMLGLTPQTERATPVAAPTGGDVIDRIEDLSDEEVDRLLANRVAK